MPGFKRLETAGITITVMAEKSRKTAIQDLQLTGKTCIPSGQSGCCSCCIPCKYSA
jgi:hypothetical protein